MSIGELMAVFHFVLGALTGLVCVFFLGVAALKGF
jgi:hypothetical protein